MIEKSGYTLRHYINKIDIFIFFILPLTKILLVVASGTSDKILLVAIYMANIQNASYGHF